MNIIINYKFIEYKSFAKNNFSNNEI